MMRLSFHKYCVITFLTFVLVNELAAQEQKKEVKIPEGSVFHLLKGNDSLVVYQCHVEKATLEFTSQSGQHVQGIEQDLSITEKYVITKRNDGFHLKYSEASYSAFPNKKFAGLKFKEKPIWNFRQISERDMDEVALRVFLALEEKGKDAIVYDYAITRYNKNQLIIRYTNDYKQLLIEGDYVISSLLKLRP